MDADRARMALQAIPADVPREEWVRAGMAAHAAGLTLEDFGAWSAPAGNYNARDCRDTWRSFKPGGVGAASLFFMAKRHGWHGTPPTACLPARQAPQRPQTPRPASTAPAAVWDRCTPATPGHPYILGKRGDPAGLRVVPEGDPLRIAGEPMAGALVVPCWRPDGTLSTLQIIAPPATAARLKAAGKPAKLNLPGARLEGWHTIGDPGPLTYIVEGIGQAWAVHQATGHPAVVAFGWGRVRSVTEQLRERAPSARLVLVPDRGKERDAQEIAKDHGAAVATMPQGEPSNFDASDLAQRDGLEALREILTAATAPRYKLLGSDDLRALPPLAWRVRGVLPASGVAALYGPSASGKSFLAMDMAAAIAEGAPWFGCRVIPTPVVYVALEGEAGIRLRAAAWEARNGRPLPDDLGVVLQSFHLTDPRDIQDLAAVMPRGGVLFVDTLNRAAPLAEENGSGDMGEILEAVKALQAAMGGIVVLVHHSGKDATKGMRGHSSLFAAMDAAVEVSRNGDRREWRVAKAKDGADGLAYPFRLNVVDLGTDDHGDPVTSCVVEADQTASDISRVKLPRGENQKLVMDALRTILARQSPLSSEYPACVPPGRVAVELEAVLPEVAACIPCEDRRKTTRAREAITGLIGRGIYKFRDGWLWRD